MNLSMYLGKKEAPPAKKSSFMGRLYKNYDKDKLQQNLLKRDWNDFVNADSPDHALTMHYSSVDQAGN